MRNQAQEAHSFWHRAWDCSIHPACLLTLFLLGSCATRDVDHHIVISAREQKLAMLEKGRLVAIYPISTSKFCLGDLPGSYGTPLGELEVAEKIGDGAAPGTVFKDRRRTGEVVGVNAPGRDPIVTRIIWLKGRETQNANAFARDIYIHGTPEERISEDGPAMAASECALLTLSLSTMSSDAAPK